ncbi:response regulator [Paenibacillus sp. CAU 1782]
MLKAMLIDDEKIALDVLEILLNEIGGVQVISKCQLVSEALASAGRLQPDIIFLDIEMPGMNGLDAGKQLSGLCPDAEIVFVTAYHQYAVQAFDARAIDYLLKPVAKERLEETLQRYARLRLRRSELEGAILQKSPEGKSRLQLKVLGSLELYDKNGKLMSWRTKKTKELFAYLWLHGGKPVHRYHLMDELWPNIDSEKAQALFHTTLYSLRNILKAEGLVGKVEFGDERYWMSTDWIGSDFGRLEELLDNGEGTAEDYTDELLSLYRGDLLEMEFYQWANAKRQELRSKFIRYLEKKLSEAGEDSKAILRNKLLQMEHI